MAQNKKVGLLIAADRQVIMKLKGLQAQGNHGETAREARKQVDEAAKGLVEQKLKALKAEGGKS